MAKKTVEEPKERLYNIILKERDSEGKSMYLGVDMIAPTFPYGKDFPVLMGVVEDKSYFVPIDQILWVEQTSGAKSDIEIAKITMEQKKVKTIPDVGFS